MLTENIAKILAMPTTRQNICTWEGIGVVESKQSYGGVEFVDWCIVCRIVINAQSKTTDTTSGGLQVAMRRNCHIF